MCLICDNKIELRTENSLMTSAHFRRGKKSICTLIKRIEKNMKIFLFLNLINKQGKGYAKRAKIIYILFFLPVMHWERADNTSSLRN